MNSPSHVESLFFSAMARPSAAERAAFLDEACDGDAELRGRLERMLEAQAAGFLDAPPDDVNVTVHLPVSERAGTKIGPYKLLQQIGEGGMGAVFMAEQAEPVRRKVALKIIKQGMDTRQVIARFEAERQALALMDHPHIARVFDAGTTESGRPYFVMELVHGVAITDYCDERQLSPRERMKLFLPVCQAVQHAHQKGIIHRDLKPSNILVAEYDFEPVAKVIDFGVAKATAQRLTDRTLFTEFGQVLGTIEYMSPEQAKFNQFDIDTRSDIYSLGVLLYELLTGETPHDRQHLRSAAFDEVLRIIREDEPLRPSTRLSSGRLPPKVAVNRRSEPAKLARLVRGELDWIVMKCLEKDRTRRYETASQLAADIQHYLQNEPVQACPPSATYRLRKFARRHSALVTYLAGLTIAMMMAVAFIVSLVRQRGATEAALAIAKTNERLALSEAAKANAVVDLLQQMLAAANPDAARGSQFTVRQMLDEFSAHFADQLRDQPEAAATIHQTIGNAYQRLGAFDKAEPQLQEALDLRRKLFGRDHVEVAEVLLNCARLKSEQGRTQEAIALAHEALATFDRLGSPDELRIKALDELALHLWAVGQWKELRPVVREIRTIADKEPNKYPELANLLHRLAETSSDPIVGEEYAREAVRLHRLLHGPNHPETAWGLRALAMTLRRQQKVDEAARYYREALQAFRASYQDGDAPVVLTLGDLAVVLRCAGDETGLAEIREVASKLSQDENPDWERWMYAGTLHAELDQWDLAEHCFSKTLELYPERVGVSYDLAWTRLASGDNKGFRLACRELVVDVEPEYFARLDALKLACLPTAPRSVSKRLPTLAWPLWRPFSADVQSLTYLGAAMYRGDQFDVARDYLARAVELANKDFTLAPYFLAMTEQRLGRPAEARKRVDQAEQAIARWKPTGKPQLLLNWRDRLALRLVQSEVKQVLEGVPAQKSSNDPVPPSSDDHRPGDEDGKPITGQFEAAKLEAQSMTSDFEQLQNAAEAGDLETVRALLESGVDQNAPVGAPHGWSPLMHAAHYGRLDVVRFLVARGAKLDAVEVDRWGTALDIASDANQLRVVEFLESAGTPRGRDIPNPYRGGKLGGWRDPH